jgi:class 3 adenylate cyclase/pimeloyl-ACP methyl ester carboxylesterase
MADIPTTRYVKSNDVHIAYQVIGDGPVDLLWVPGFVSHMEVGWQNPLTASMLRHLSSFSRLVLFDKRGTGMSDRGSQIFTLEQRMHDVQAILDEIGSERAVLFGVSEGGPMSLLYAASYPERTAALVLYGSYAKRSWAADYPFGWKDEQWDRVLGNIEHNWGTPQGTSLAMWAPSLMKDPVAAERMASYFRAAASPGAAAAIMKMNREIDVRKILPTIRTPTLILHRTGDRVTEIGHARYMAQHIPDAKLIELSGIDHTYWIGGEVIVDHIEQFVTGSRQKRQPERMLATVMFVDVVDSTQHAARLGDNSWRQLLETFYGKVREVLQQYKGREINTTGDGLLAIFDGPARAVRCAGAIRDIVRTLGLEVRCGLHTGECEIVAEDLAGIAVHIGARVASLADAGTILVSQTLRDLVAGSGLAFESHGSYVLKGVPGEWQLYRAIDV